MVLIGEASPRPADHRDFKIPECCDHIVAQAARVRDRRVLAHPKAAVDAVTEMLCELPVDVPADSPFRLVGANREFSSERGTVLGRRAQPVAIERLSLTPQGNVRYSLRTPYRDGTTHIIFEPLDFLARLASLVPSPRVNLARFHGVFAANH
jgi:hypothetical protein